MRDLRGFDQYRRQVVQRIVCRARTSLGTLRETFDRRTNPSCGSWRIGCTVPRRCAGVPALYHALSDLQPAVTLEDEPTVSVLLTTWKRGETGPSNPAF